MNHVIVLTAAPVNGLPDAAIAEVRGRLDAPGRVRRLSADAAEIEVAVRQTARANGIDVNCVPASNRRKRLLIADMDSTMIGVECIDEVADMAGVRDAVVAITEPAMRGEIGFEDALRARVAQMAGLAEARLADVWRERIALNPGARALVVTMRAHGAHTALVSGGFSYFTARVAAAAGFDEHRANRLVIEDGHLTGAVAEPILGRQAKLDALGEMIATHRLGAGDTLAVGDGANDLAMIEAAGLGVAYHAKPVVAANAGAAVVHGDLTALLYLQGYSASEFVTG